MTVKYKRLFQKTFANSLFLSILCLCLSGTIPAQEPNDTLFRFAHLSDTHVSNSVSVADLQATVNDINQLATIEFVIISGDITEVGSDEELARAKQELDKLNKPWYIVPGNHDTKWSESGTTTFKRIFGGETFCFSHKGFLFIGTGSGPNMRMGPGQIQREDLTMIDSVLRVNKSKALPIFFVNHYPLNNGLNNWYEVLDRMKGRNLKAVLCGHGHANRALSFEGIPGVMGRSNLRAKDSIGGYNIVTVTNHAMVYNERRPDGHTLPSWHSLPLNQTAPKWEEHPSRPDYSMNRQYAHVKEKWTIQESADIGAGVGVYKNGVIYTTTGGDIKSVDRNSGRLLWTYKTGSKIYSTPLIVQSSVIVPATNGIVYCLDGGTGRKRWSFASAKPYVSSASSFADLVIVSGSDGSCRALDLHSGKVAWEFNQVSHFVETRPLVDDSSVYFGSWGNEFYSLDARTGKLNWKWTNTALNRLFSPAACWPVEADGKVFIVAPDRYMTAFDKRTGNVIWRVYDTANWARESMGISGDKQMIYVKTMQGRILAIRSSGTERSIAWTSPMELGQDICPSPIIARKNMIFVPTESGVVYALDHATGDLRWKHKFSNCLINTIQPLDDHTLVTTTMDGKVTCVNF